MNEKKNLRKSVIFIHGAGQQEKGYSDTLWDILWEKRRENQSTVHHYEMFYYDIFEKTNAKIEKQAQKFKISQILEGLLGTSGLADRIDETLKTTAIKTVSQVLYFLLFIDFQTAVINKFKQTLIKLLKEAEKEGYYPRANEITIISHSLGTVIGYTGLHRILGLQALGLQSGVRVKNFFTLATPLALVAEIGKRLNISPADITGEITKPEEFSATKKITVSNIIKWYSYRHEYDPVASLVPLKGNFLDNPDSPPFVFQEVHRGNVHFFGNYLEQARDFILDKILEEQ